MESLIANWISIIFGSLFAVVLLSVFWMYIADVLQTTHAVRRNYPVIGRLRYRMERLGEYFRQYFFAHDREEMPFNRATRAWIYRTAKGLGGMVGFGSTNDLREAGSVIFVNASFPRLEEEHTPMPPLIIGAPCDKPFIVQNIFNISGMSYGAISNRRYVPCRKGPPGPGFG